MTRTIHLYCQVLVTWPEILNLNQTQSLNPKPKPKTNPKPKHKTPMPKRKSNRDDQKVVFYYPILSCFWKMISVSDPNPVLVEIILSVSENYPKVHYDAQHTFLCFVYCASCGKIASGVILPSAEHDWLKQSHDKFGTHVLLSWTWYLQQLNPMHGWWLSWFQGW